MNEMKKHAAAAFYRSHGHLHITQAARRFADHDLRNEIDYFSCPSCESESENSAMFRRVVKLPGKQSIRATFHCTCGRFSGVFDVDYSDIYEFLQTVER